MAILAPAAVKPNRPVGADRLPIVNHGAALETTALAIETRGLTKRYGSIAAVDALDLGVRRGEVYGFLGPNGAGKTTTLRMLLGLIEQTSGSISLMGSKPGSPETLVNIGSMIETPAFYPFLSGHDNLKMLAAYTGAERRRIDEVLDQVDLAARARDSFASYSLGMKQRLGVAAALLKDPPLLLLDEPTNGLDPAGQREIRAIIPRLADQGHGVLLASHMLHEVEQVSDRVLIVRRGKLITEGSVDDLLRRGGYIEIVAPGHDLEAAQRAIRPVPHVEQVTIENGKLIVVAPEEIGADLNRALVEQGIFASAIAPRHSTLEDLFLELTDETEIPA